MRVTGTDTALDTLKKLYKKTLLPLERYIAFPAPPLSDVDFDALPLVLVVGQYSTGKTTFIRHMLGRDFPSQRVGPEPTTDRFTGIVASGAATEGVVPGLVAVHDPAFPFGVLDQLGDVFLSRFVVARTDAPLARRVVFLDTPGVSPRSSVVDVARCLARRVDKVIVMFDATKMVLCDQMRHLIEVFADYDEKLLFVLNKSDSLSYHQLMRVYGALMWSLSKVLRSPETRKIFIGSFWERPLHYDVCRSLLESEERDLSTEIENLPQSAAMRKLDAFVARAREVQVYAKAASVLRPRHFSARRPRLDVAFSQLRRLLPHVPPADFPDLAAVRRNRNLRKPRTALLSALDAMLDHDVPNLVAEMQPSPCVSTTTSHRWDHYDQGCDSRPYFALFKSLKPITGKVTGAAAKHEMIKSKLPNSCLRKIWKLADADKDGMLDITEFTVAMQLVELKVAGFDLPYEVSSDAFCSTTHQPSSLRPRSAHAFLMTNTCNKRRGGTSKRILDNVPELLERSLTTPSCRIPFDVSTALPGHDAHKKSQSYEKINFSSKIVQSESKFLEVSCGDKKEPQKTSSDTPFTSPGANSCLTLIEEDANCLEDLPRSTVAVPVCGENTQHIRNTEIKLASIPYCLTNSDYDEQLNCSTHSSATLQFTDCCKTDDCCYEVVVGDDAPKHHDSTMYAETDVYEPLDEIREYRRGPTEMFVDLKDGNCDEKLYTRQSAAKETIHGILPSSKFMQPSCVNDNFSPHISATSEGNENTRNDNAANVTCLEFGAAELKTENPCSSYSRIMRSSSLKSGIATYNLDSERSAFLDRCSIQKSPDSSDDCCEHREPFYDITNIDDSRNVSKQCVLPADVVVSEEITGTISGGNTDPRSRSAELQSGNRDRDLKISPRLSSCFHDSLVRVRFACNCEDCTNYSKIPGSACSSETNKSPPLAFQYDRGFSRKGDESARKLDRECEVGLESRWRAHERSKSSQLTFVNRNNDIDTSFRKVSGYQPNVKSGEELTEETERSQVPYTCVVADAVPEREASTNKSMNGISWEETACGWRLPAGSSLNATERDILPGSEPNLATGTKGDYDKSPLHQRKWWTEPRKRISNLCSKYEVPEYNCENANKYMTKYDSENSDWILTESQEVGDDSEEDADFKERRQCNEHEKRTLTLFNRPTQIFGSTKPRFGIMSDSENDTRGLASYLNEGSSLIPLPVIRPQEPDNTRNLKTNAAISTETVTKFHDDDNGGGASSSTSERQSWSREVNAAANRSRHPKRVLLSAAEETFVKNSDFYRFVDGIHLSDTNDAHPYVSSSDTFHKSSYKETTSMSPIGVNNLGFTALSSASPSNSRHSDGGDFNLSYRQHPEPTCWHSSKENCGCSDANENRQPDSEDLSSSRVGGNGDTGDGQVCPERDFSDHNQYRQDEEH